MMRTQKERATKEFALCYIDGDVPAQQAVYELCGLPREQEFRKSILLTQVFEVIKLYPRPALEHEFSAPPPPIILSALIGPALDPASFKTSFQQFLQKLKDRPLYGMAFVFSSYCMGREQMYDFWGHVHAAAEKKYPGLRPLPWLTDEADCKQFKQRLVSTEVKEYRAEKILRDNEDGRTGGQGHHHGDESKPCGTPAGEPPVIIIRSGAHERHFRVSDTFRTSDALVRHLRLYVEGVEEVHPRPDLRQG